jgi:uncharacterized protein
MIRGVSVLKGFEQAPPPYDPERGYGAAGARPAVCEAEPWSVDPSDWGTFLATIFDEWYEHDLGRLYVQYFDAAVETWMGRINPLCILAPMCGKGVAIENDGTVYSCDHFVYPEFALGNVSDHSLAELVLSPRQELFGKAKEGLLPGQCRGCTYQFACFGGCPKNRLIVTADGEPGLNYLCRGWKHFFAHIDGRMQTVVRRLGYTPQHGKGISFDGNHA